MSRSDLLSTGAPELARSSHRSTALEQLRAAVVADGATPARDEILRLVEANRDIAMRTARPGHLTGSAIVIDAAATSTLLMLHAKLGRWFQPGGHADGDTNLAAVALREATEETGIAGLRISLPAIDVDIHEVRPPAEDPHLHLDLRFLVLAPEGASEVANEESLALRWVRPDELDDLRPSLDPGTRRLVARGLSEARRLR